MNNLLEICCGDIESVANASRGGADRVELCSALAEGGVTPSVGLMTATERYMGSGFNVLIRPRGGDFVYTADEVDMMCQDISTALLFGAGGVVIGALTPEGDIDMPACRRMMQAANGQPVTFHRAFDMVRNADKALEDVISLGCNRILTSGLAASAEEGIPTLKKLVAKAKGRISIMPGGGVNKDNARRILAETGAHEIHASSRSPQKSSMKYRNPSVNMGAKGVDEYLRLVTSEGMVKEIKKAISNQ